MSKVDFSVGDGIYMLPSNMNLNINKTEGFNNEILIAEPSYKLGVNHRVNKILQKKSTEPKPKRLPTHEKKSAQDHNEEKIVVSILIMSTALLVYFLW